MASVKCEFVSGGKCSCGAHLFMDKRTGEKIGFHHEGCEQLDRRRNPAKPKPRAKPVGRWSHTLHSDGVAVFHYREDSERLAIKSVDPAVIVDLLNAAGVVLPKARRRS